MQIVVACTGSSLWLGILLFEHHIPSILRASAMHCQAYLRPKPSVLVSRKKKKRGSFKLERWRSQASAATVLGKEPFYLLACLSLSRAKASSRTPCNQAAPIMQDVIIPIGFVFNLCLTCDESGHTGHTGTSSILPTTNSLSIWLERSHVVYRHF